MKKTPSDILSGVDVKSTILAANKWMELRTVDDDGYTFGHMTHGDGVSVLGFNQSGKILIRMEYTPAHHITHKPTSLTGTIEDGLSPEETAIKELKEESGYEAEIDELIPYGWVYPTKFLDYRQFLFAVDLTGKTQGPILGDGSSGEVGATVVWVPRKMALVVTDPSVAAIVAHLTYDDTLPF